MRGDRHWATCRSHNKRPTTTRATKGLTKQQRAASLAAISNRGVGVVDCQLCDGCGGRHQFDTSVPSAVWNAVIRANKLPEYLCLSCIVRAFALAGQSFTATLWGESFGGLPIELRINNTVAQDATRISEENTALRVEVERLQEQLGGLVPVQATGTPDA